MVSLWPLTSLTCRCLTTVATLVITTAVQRLCASQKHSSNDQLQRWSQSWVVGTTTLDRLLAAPLLDICCCQRFNCVSLTRLTLTLPNWTPINKKKTISVIIYIKMYINLEWPAQPRWLDNSAFEKRVLLPQSHCACTGRPWIFNRPLQQLL